MAWDIPWREGGELPEYICQENNQYLNRLEDDLGKPIFGPRPQPGQQEVHERDPLGDVDACSTFSERQFSRIALALPLVAGAQFGHPLKGQWSGQWGPADNPKRLLLDLHWDGKAITGVINPGPEAATVKSVTFDYTDPSAWVVQDAGRRERCDRQAGADQRGRQAREHRRLHASSFTARGRRPARKATSRSHAISEFVNT